MKDGGNSLALYILKRILSIIPVLIIASFLSYALVSVVPGSTAEIILQIKYDAPPSQQRISEFNEENGLDKSLIKQYTVWLTHAVRGDFGKSLRNDNDIWTEYKKRFAATATLFLTAELISIAIALPLGVLSAKKANTLTDHALRSVALGGISIPNFGFGILLIYVFSVNLHLLPVFGYGSPKNLIMPALTLGIPGAMSLMRLTRTSVLEVTRLNYIRTARAKGVAEPHVSRRHILRNALIPVVTSIGMHLGHMFGGTVVIESLFAWPGLGRYFADAATSRDIPVIQSCVFFSAILFVVINLLVDLTYMALDPRISYSSKGR